MGRLDGCRVLVTRAAHQAEGLCRGIAEEGGEAISYPTLVILPPRDPGALRGRVGAFADYDIALFVSVNAVHFGLELLVPRPRPPRLPAIGAVGPTTSRVLEDAGLPVTIRSSEGFTTEALLVEPALNDVEGKRVLIVRGDRGRGLLRQTLEERGAEVTYAEVYRRRRAETDPGELIELWRTRGVHVVTAGSVETLANLHAMLGPAGQALLRDAQLVTASERVVKHAASLGLKQWPIRASAPDDKAMVAAILRWWTARPDGRSRER